jgi:hypothetical protein
MVSETSKKIYRFYIGTIKLKIDNDLKNNKTQTLEVPRIFELYKYTQFIQALN